MPKLNCSTIYGGITMENMLERILDSDKEAGALLEGARAQQEVIAKETVVKKREIEDRLKEDTAKMMTQLAAEYQQKMQADADASDAAFAEKKAAMQQHYDQNKALWLEKVTNALLSK